MLEKYNPCSVRDKKFDTERRQARCTHRHPRMIEQLTRRHSVRRVKRQHHADAVLRCRIRAGIQYIWCLKKNRSNVVTKVACFAVKRNKRNQNFSSDLTKPCKDQSPLSSLGRAPHAQLNLLALLLDWTKRTWLQNKTWFSPSSLTAFHTES